MGACEEGRADALLLTTNYDMLVVLTNSLARASFTTGYESPAVQGEVPSRGPRCAHMRSLFSAHPELVHSIELACANLSRPQVRTMTNKQ